MSRSDSLTLRSDVDLAVVFEVHEVEALRRRHGHERRDLVAGAERVDHVGQLQVGQAVGVVGEEHLLVLDVLAHRHEPLPDVGVQAGVDERDLPVGDVVALELDLLAAVRQREVVRDPFLVVEEEVLDDVGLVAEAEDELLVAEVRVVAHDVPQHGAVADLDHRLGLVAE